MTETERRKMVEELTQEILPEFTKRISFNGGLRLDTDTLDLENERDRSYMVWLSRIVARFVVEDREALLAEGEASDAALRILMDRARGDAARKSGYFFNRDSYTAGLRTVYEFGVKHGEEKK